ncbi:uncharacterized protein BP01DRAFT_387708 [Aspergillus saccharolyticus JOP 1030-1]|uniref:Uncharacterized protein n=1 Tax=Aspergillus saccharolyticus JOP 1030-1 TaxID=1450539 RepID=A0A318Z0Y5_9EURO|nr:hypothetical protein BP01DRAFT_387708 [Aspergillus saccharolyticus JOP 1030-1]PYH40034.1 hypothetical protein BP01DRAFT_387708 [Aspergillus saccharolyticus JOP 1030-1]
MEQSDIELIDQEPPSSDDSEIEDISELKSHDPEESHDSEGSHDPEGPHDPGESYDHAEPLEDIVLGDIPPTPEDSPPASPPMVLIDNSTINQKAFDEIDFLDTIPERD